MTHEHDTEIVSRAAPRWAWEEIDALLAMPGVRTKAVVVAEAAMIDCCEHPEWETMDKEGHTS